MDLHRPDITLLDRTKIQAEVLVPVYKALERQLGTTDLARASTYLERPLRLTAHLIMSSPEFQLC